MAVRWLSCQIRLRKLNPSSGIPVPDSGTKYDNSVVGFKLGVDDDGISNNWCGQKQTNNNNNINALKVHEAPIMTGFELPDSPAEWWLMVGCKGFFFFFFNILF